MRKIIDCHCHIYPEKIAAKAVESIGRFYDIEMDNNGTLEDLKVAGGAAGITQYLIFSVATTPRQVSSINKFIADMVAAHPGLMTGLGTLHPDSLDQAADIYELISLGLKGVKLHPDIQGIAIDDERCMKMYALCEGKLPILFHTGDFRYDMSNPDRVKHVMDTFPNLKVIGAHFGGYRCWENADVYKGLDNVYFDTCSSLPFIDADFAKKIIDMLGAEKFFFGTDFPMWDASGELERFNAIKLTDKERQNILSKNIKNLLKI